MQNSPRHKWSKEESEKVNNIWCLYKFFGITQNRELYPPQEKIIILQPRGNEKKSKYFRKESLTMNLNLE